MWKLHCIQWAKIPGFKYCILNLCFLGPVVALEFSGDGSVAACQDIVGNVFSGAKVSGSIYTPEEFSDCKLC